MCHESHGAHHKSYRSDKGSHKGSHQDVQGIPERIDKGLETIRGNLESSHNFNIILELNVISAIQCRKYFFSINKNPVNTQITLHPNHKNCHNNAITCTPVQQAIVRMLALAARLCPLCPCGSRYALAARLCQNTTIKQQSSGRKSCSGSAAAYLPQREWVACGGIGCGSVGGSVSVSGNGGGGGGGSSGGRWQRRRKWQRQ